jgi:hypothetical protein
MNTVELLQYSLDTAFGIFSQVTADLTQEQIDWQPPGVVNTIGSIYSHILTYVDWFVQDLCIDQNPFPESVEAAVKDHGMRHVQADLAALHENAGTVWKKAQGWLSSLTPADLEIIRNTTVGELNQGQMMEIYIIWHINVHCGEIAALKGCQGAKGYPF